ncbi:PilZ domain-containing protein [Hahella sp. SMD15-11]|uniref:PilZ domain-containing protein n=1 Tax=Thermohahella caldifontis TaxID=3142973 RepID=A0AB39UY37_9GAMM
MSFEPVPGHDNKRTEPRLARFDALEVEVVLPSHVPEGEPPELLCAKVLDVSANGLQLQLGRALPTQFIPEIRVDDEALGHFDLKGIVRWTRRLPGQAGWVSGIELLEDLDTHIVEWKEALCTLLDDSAPDHVCF